MKKTINSTIPTMYAHVELTKYQTEQVEGLLLVKVRPSLWLITDAEGNYKAHANAKYKAELVLKKFVEGAKKLAEERANQAKKAAKKTADTAKKTAKKATRVARRLVNNNVMGFRFGQKVSQRDVQGYMKKAWKGVFKVDDADIVNGYWGGIVEHVKTGQKFQVVRLDYVINYLRPPKGSETFEDVRKCMAAMGVAKAD